MYFLYFNICIFPYEIKKKKTVFTHANKNENQYTFKHSQIITRTM